MAGSWRISLGVLAAMMLIAPSASAFGGRFGWWRGAGASNSAPSYASGYWAGPYEFCPPPRVIPVPDARPRLRYADPVPAPPSATPEPPVFKKASRDPSPPIITAAHVVGTVRKTPTAMGCKVAFWNLSSRDVTIVIDGKTWNIAKDRSVRLDLNREFAWQVQGQPQHVERVPANQATHEIVIRK